MNRPLASSCVSLLLLAGSAASAQTSPPADALPTPGFHHVHLRSINPEAAISFYTRHFPTTSRTSFAGEPALQSPNSVMLLFHKVEMPPPSQPQSAVWHFGWHVLDAEQTLATYKTFGSTLLPLYRSWEGETVAISGQSWPNIGDTIGRTRAQIEDARATGLLPARDGGFGYLRGPDDQIVEFQGNMKAERFNHVHMYWTQPFCDQLWYVRHLNAARAAPREGQVVRSEADCAAPRGSDRSWPALTVDGMHRSPASYVTFGDVALYAYVTQNDVPLAATRGQGVDHFALSVSDLDAWLAKMERENVKILERPYALGSLRAMMIEGPNREAIELVEVK